MSVTISDCRVAAQEVFGVTRKQMLGASRARKLVRPRQVAMAIAYAMTGMSLPRIGVYFSNRDHTTVLHAVRVAATLSWEDESWRERIAFAKRLAIIVAENRVKAERETTSNPLVTELPRESRLTPVLRVKIARPSRFVGV